MKITKTLLIAVIIFSISCKSEKEKAAEDFTSVRNVIERFAHAFGGVDTLELKGLFESEMPLPQIFLSQPDNPTITFALNEIEIQKEISGNYSVTIPYILTGKNRSSTQGIQEFLIVETPDSGFKIISFSSNIATSAIRLADRAVADAERTLYYDSLFKDSETIANGLRNNFDSVIYVSSAGQAQLYYVVKGEWKYPYSFKGPQHYAAKVGVLDASGKIIVPAKFDKVYNLDGTIASYIEVEADKKRGLYTIDGREFLPAKYDVIYPSNNEEDVVCLVKQNGKLGKVLSDGSVAFYENENAIKVLEPVLAAVNFNFPGQAKVLRYPYSPDQYGDAPIDTRTAVIITPSYLIDLGFAKNEYYPDLVLSDNQMGTIEMRMSVKNTVNFSDKVIAVFALFYESAIDARDYSFERTDLLTLDENLNRVAVVEGLCESGNYQRLCGEESFRQVNAGLFEIRKVLSSRIEPYHMMEQYQYYTIGDDGKVQYLETNRVFSFTKFVKMDNSYFSTCAYRGVDYNQTKNKEYHYNTLIYNELSSADLDLMRNEIFAEYGYKFTSEKWKKHFSSKSWYKPLYDDVNDKLTDIDRHNLQMILEHQKSMKMKTIKPDSILHVVAG